MAEALLRVSHLTKAFSLSRHEALRAVSDVSFSLAPGEIFGLVGESGSGKSTLARTISGLYRPTAGQVFLEELEISLPGTESTSPIPCNFCFRTAWPA